MKNIISVEAVRDERGLSPDERIRRDGGFETWNGFYFVGGRTAPLPPKYLVTIVYEVDDAGLEELQAEVPASLREGARR